MVIVAALLVAIYLYEGATERDAGRIRQQQLAPEEQAPGVPSGAEAGQQAFESVDETLPPPIPDPVAGAATPPSATEDRSMAAAVIAPEPVFSPEPAAQQSVSVTVSASSGPATVDAGGMRLSLIFSEDSWAEITDPTGRRILYGLQRAGTRRELSSEPPIGVFLGNAPGVEVLIDGSEYSISSGARRGNIARFEIQPDIQP